MSRMQLIFVITWWYILSFKCIGSNDIYKDGLVEDSVNITTNWYLTAGSVQVHKIACKTCRALPRQAYLVIDQGKKPRYYKFTEDTIDKLLSWAAKFVWNHGAQQNFLEEPQKLDFCIKASGHLGKFEPKEIRTRDKIGVFNIETSMSLIAAIKQLASLDGYNKAGNKDEWLNEGVTRLKLLKFGNYIVEIETYFFYARLVGRIHGSKKVIYNVPEYYYKKVWNQFYPGMIDSIKDYNQFSEVVLNWITNGEPKCSDDDAESCAITAQLATALFISEPTRNFRVHITNMMSLDRFHNNDGLSVKDFLENHPMARGKTWPVKKENGLNYKTSKKEKNRELKAIREGVEERIQKTIFDWCHLFKWTIKKDIRVRFNIPFATLEKGKYSCIIDDSDKIKDDGDILLTSYDTRGAFKLLACYIYVLGKFGPVTIHSQTHNDKDKKLVEQEMTNCFTF